MFQKARLTNRIKDTPVTQVIEVLNKGYLKLGIKGDRAPDNIETQLIVNELRTYYIGLKIEELELAFSLASRDLLDISSETYQNFSVLYLNKMISSYLRWARTKIKDIPEEKPKQIEFKVGQDEIIQTSFDSYKRTKDWMNIFNCLRTFEILYERQLTGEGLMIFEASDVQRVVNITEKAIKDRIMNVEPEEKKQLIRNLKDDAYMENACRRMAVALYFTKLMKSNL
jgi:hypothetical protein